MTGDKVELHPADHSDLGVLSSVAAELAAALASLGSDIALVIEGGVIRNVAIGPGAENHPARQWLGRPWVETVSVDTREKVERMLCEVERPGGARRREVNHPNAGGDDLPISYSALRLGANGPVIAVGRDLRAVAAIQQRLVDAQSEMEREYWRLRRETAQQRLLVQIATDAALVVDAETLRVLHANPVAATMFGGAGGTLPAAVEKVARTALSTGRGVEVRVRLVPSMAAPVFDVSATPFRVASDGSQSLRLLVRARDISDDGTSPAGQAVVVVDPGGRIRAANSAFASLARSGPSRLEGQLLAEAVGDPQRHLASLLVDARREGMVVRSDVLLGGSGLATFAAEIRATLMADGDQECLGLAIVRTVPQGDDDLGATLSSLVSRVGTLSLEELVQRARDTAERQAIEVALHQAGHDLRQAAALLGVEDEDLAGRLRRLGLTRHAP